MSKLIVSSLLVAVLGSSSFATGSPRVAGSVPANGAADVDPAMRHIVVTFDTAMKTDGFSVLQSSEGAFPELSGDEPLVFRDAKTFVMSIKLSPGRGYAIRLNSESRQGFRAVDGAPLPPTVIRFRTHGGEAVKPESRKGGLGYVDEDDDLEPAPKEDRRATPKERADKDRASVRIELPSGWTLMDDKLFGSQVAVPPGWTPRLRGDVALSVEPDALATASAFFVPMLLKGHTRPESLADGFDEMLRRAVPDLRTQTTGKPSSESVQRDLAATISGTRVAGSYRAVVSHSGTGFIMGYLAPTEQVEALKPAFFKILQSYRYTGPKMRLQPFKSAAVELRIPQGWTVWTSEGQGAAKHDIDWVVSCPQVPGARAFMFSPKYISPNWVSDMMTGQPDPQGLAIWQMKGYQLAQFQSDEQALQHALGQVMPGLEIVRQQSLEEIRQLLQKVFAFATQTIQSTGGQMRWYAFEILGRRQVQGVEMRSIITLGMNSMYTPGGVKGTLGMWQAQVRGIEAPADHFAQLASVLDRVNNSFSYTLWWIKTVQKANEQQARTIKKFWEHSNRIDKEIFDNRMKTQGAISEMMYDNLTENYGYLNKETGSIEKIPAEHLEKFRRQDGEIVSPEGVIDKQLPVEQARPLREAWADDYMSFDRRVQVWP